MTNKLSLELESFQNIWHGGFIASNNDKRNQVGLENFLLENSRLLGSLDTLEIGCGRGRWSKFIKENLKPRSLTCVDAKGDVDNGFWEYMGDSGSGVNYHQVKNFNLDEVADNSIDFVFSYDVWCHISLSGQRAYLRALQKKCRPGAVIIIMYSDPQKYYQSEPENFWFIKADLPKGRINMFTSDQEVLQMALEESDGPPHPGRWYWVGREAFIKNALHLGYEVIKEDLGIDKTNIISALRKVE